MKITIHITLEREDGPHSGTKEWDIDDEAAESPVEAMMAALPISADIMDGIIFLIGHDCTKEKSDLSGLIGFDHPLVN